MTKIELFLKLANPDSNGKSRWVNKSEFIGEFLDLNFENGFSWGRKEGYLAKKYIVETDKSITPGNKIDSIRLNGFNDSKSSNYIRADIKKEIQSSRCIILGTSKPEVDHKNGMKNDSRVWDSKNQKLSDFQPLSKAANDAKRQACKECMRNQIRFDAKKLGYPVSYYSGKAEHNFEEQACVGCFWYDPIEFRKHLKS